NGKGYTDSKTDPLQTAVTELQNTKVNQGDFDFTVGVIWDSVTPLQQEMEEVSPLVVPKQITDWDDATTQGYYWGIGAINGPTRPGTGTGTWFSGTVMMHPGDNPPDSIRLMQEAKEAY